MLRGGSLVEVGVIITAGLVLLRSEYNFMACGFAVISLNKAISIIMSS